MSTRTHDHPPAAQRLLDEPRRCVGIDASGATVRLGERDCDGRRVGFIDADGLAWESLRECLVATAAARIAEALALPIGAERERALAAALAELPRELAAEAAREASWGLEIADLDP
jgi:hypothetical protein